MKGHEGAMCFGIASGRCLTLENPISPRALGLVMEWAMLHKQELMADLELANSNQPPLKIEPLE